MNRLACRVIVAVAGMAVLGMTATLAGAQTHPATYTLNDVSHAIEDYPQIGADGTLFALQSDGNQPLQPVALSAGWQWRRLATEAIPSSDVEEPRIPFRLVRDSLVVVPVVLNGRGGYQFLLDTGATHSILSSEVADQLNIRGGAPQRLITAGGDIPVTMRTIDTLQIGGVRITQMPIAAADFNLLRNLHVDGILGADCLKQFKISIDYGHKVLTLKP